jgi:hypothetical protein
MADPRFALQFSERQVAQLAGDYSYPEGDTNPADWGRTIRRRGHLTKPEFLELCRWKSPRTGPLVASNPADLVEATTHAALKLKDERAKIGVLRLLAGVSWPTASVILHFCDRRPYPILDYRALWSLGYAKPPVYTFDFWMAYVEFTRALAKRTGHSMRDVDRALWQHSKDKQR